LLQTLFSDVKLVLEALTNIPATRQRLIYRGRVLRDDSSLQEQGDWVVFSPSSSFQAGNAQQAQDGGLQRPVVQVISTQHSQNYLSPDCLCRC
jgi:hypothetical protein